MSFYTLQVSQFEIVVYNELNTGVVSLLKDIKDNKLQDRHYQFIDRETFHKHKNDNDWFGTCTK